MDIIIEEGCSMLIVIEMTNFRETQNYRGQNHRSGNKDNYRNDTFVRGT